MASASLPLGAPPPLGLMLSQKKVWFHTCRKHKGAVYSSASSVLVDQFPGLM
jgi:hypothetical protein